MHSPERISTALALKARGLTATEASRELEIPRATVRDGFYGRLPGGGRSLDPNAPPSCGKCGGEAHDFAAIDADYAYLLGIYLGDGCISTHPRNVYRLRVTLDTAYPGIVDECERSIAAVMPASRVGRYYRRGKKGDPPPITHVDVNSYSKSWPCLLPQHGPGVKHLREIVLRDWQLAVVERDPRPFLRGLIHSDGCRFINTGTNWIHPRYLFSNTSSDIRRIFVSACELLGLHTTHAPRTIYVSRKADVATMDQFIGPKR